MNIFVTGANGQLGYDVINELIGRGHRVTGCDITEAANYNYNFIPLDITDRSALFCALEQAEPDAIIHCAAWTAVDAAEEEENKEAVFLVNATSTDYIAEYCKEHNCKMIYISTDYVFGDNTETAREADCKNFAPLNVYGESKLLGEKAVAEALTGFFIVRISWVFGKNGNNFVKTMLNLSKKFDSLRVVNDQIGTPTYTYDLAKLLADMVVSDKYGYYHATNEGGDISWYDFAKEIFRIAGLNMNITPVTTEEYGVSKAARPKNSRLSKEKLKAAGFTPMPTWQDALGRFIKEIDI